MIEYTSRDQECIAYLSALVTLELCAEIHRKGKPNTAIRKCCARLLLRLKEHPRISVIFEGLAKQPFPAGCLHSLRSWLEERAPGQVVLED